MTGGEITAGQALMAAAAIGGTMMQQQAMADAEARQRQALNQMLLKDEQYADRAQQLVQQEAQNYQPAQREQAEQAAEDAAYGSLATKLTAATSTMPTSQLAGKVSDDFLVDRARRSSEEMQRSADTARLMAKMRAPNDMRFAEGLSIANNAAEIGSMARDRSAMASAGSMTAQRAGQPSGMQMMLGQGAQNLGISMLGQSLMSKVKAPPIQVQSPEFIDWGA
ncbi:MAG: hypothetical protein IT531_00060 [Burkholderiales bacterium]|nr:hypothetical protein [Burkholderiales bacterium]